MLHLSSNHHNKKGPEQIGTFLLSWAKLSETRLDVGCRYFTTLLVLVVPSALRVMTMFTPWNGRSLV